MSFASHPNTKQVILQQAEQYDSFYLYGQHEIICAAQQLKQHFPSVGFLYSLKNNPCTEIAKTLVAQGFGSDAASLAEVLQSKDLGLAAEQIQYSAPGKTECDIAQSLPHATLIADSINEVYRINNLAAQQGMIAKIGLRIHPNFSFDALPPAPSKFGIEEAQVFAALASLCALPNICIVGVHIHCRSQCLCAAQIAQYHKNVISLALRVQEALDKPLSFLNMGAGLGIPYAPEDTALPLCEIAAITNESIAQLHAINPSIQVYIETGRYCVGNNGVYVSKVLDKKTCDAKTYVILANTLNGYLRPHLATLLEANCSNPTAAEPLYTAKHAFSSYPLYCTKPDETKPPETVTLVGNLCTATDVLASDVTLPCLNCGDVMVTTNAGSYAAVLSPMQFSQQRAPMQLFLKEDGTVTLA